MLQILLTAKPFSRLPVDHCLGWLVVSHVAGRAIYIISHAGIQEMHYEHVWTQIMLMAHGVDTFDIRQANALVSSF